MPLASLKGQKTARSKDKMIKHLKKFSLDMKFSTGVWCVWPGPSRFHEAYVKKGSLEQVFEKLAPLARHGLGAVEAHYPNEINEENAALYKKLGRETGIRLITVIPLLFYGKEFEFGALSSPLKPARAKAIATLKAALRLNKQLNTDFCVIWPGIDGYENPFGIDIAAAHARFIDGVAEAMDEVCGVRVAIEPKPYEPRGRIYFGYTAEGIIAAEEIEKRLRAKENLALLKKGEPMVCLNPEVGHILMGCEDLAHSFTLICERGRLAHTHLNSQPLGNYDQDLNVGVVSPEQMEAGLYALKMRGYRGYFGLDIYPERMPSERAILNCIDALRSMNDRIDSLDHEKVLECTYNPDKNRGYLEAMLIRARARAGGLKKLSPLPKFER